MNKEDISRVAIFLETLNPVIGLAIPRIELFEEALKEMENHHSTHQAIGFIASGYEVKQKEQRFRIERMHAVLNLLKVYRESEKDIAEIKSMKTNQDKIERMFG